MPQGDAGGSANAGAGAAGMDVDAGTPPPVDAGSSTDTGTPADDAATSGVACNLSPPVFPSFDRSCDTAADCAIGWRAINCCGGAMATGFRVSETDAFRAAAATCGSQFPLCGCAPGPTVADDGTMQDVAGTATAVVDCVDRTCLTSFAALAGSTPCGPQGMQCDSATEVCVARTPVGPAIIHDCQPVPPGCEGTRTCACVAQTLCVSGFNHCIDEGNNAVTCECPQCQ
jgi:hypothetical protein